MSVQYYRLRWRFDYSDGKPSKFGMWSRDPDNISEKASMQSKENLSRAAIEGKCCRTFQIVTLAECPGVDFCNFEWMAEFRARMGDVNAGYCRNVGLTLVDRDNRTKVGFNGEIKTEIRSEQDKNFHYEGYGK